MPLEGDQMKKLILGITISALVAVATAATDSTYAGQELREIKALSQQEVEDYLNGKGLGYAKAAELNRYPGPRHVLDMAEELSLTAEQITRTQTIFDVMKAQAIPLGKQLVGKEQALDRQFTSEAVSGKSLKTLLSDIGALQAKIRYVHLSAHLEQKALLTEYQIQLYDQLRGYGASHDSGHIHAH